MFLGDHFGYPSGVAHGVTVYHLNVLPALQRAGVVVAACFLREPHPAAHELVRMGIDPTFLSANPLDPTVVFRVIDIVRKADCDILHSSGLKATLVARIVGRILGKEVIVHVHDMYYPGRLLKRLHGMFSRSTDVGIAVSHAVKEVAIDGYHVRPERVRVIHNGLQLDRFRSVLPETRQRIRLELNIAESRSVMVMIGRMYPVKGHMMMMKMMGMIVRERPESILVLAGDGPERAACEALVHDLGLRDHVRFLGHRNDVPDLLVASDILVMPSQSEGLPFAAIEAMALGKPVVAFNSGGVGDVITDGADGRLVEPGNQQAFVSAVVALLEDRQMMKVCGVNAVIASERFSLEHHIQELLQCYREIAAVRFPVESGNS